MGKSAFNKLAEQYIVTKNAVNKEVSRQLEVIVAETTDGDDMDEIALKLKAMLKGTGRFVPISLQMLRR